MKTVLLLIPGMFNTADVWKPVADLLQPDVDVRIANVLTQSSIVNMAADAWRLVADLPEGTPRVVCGFSMGGYVLIELLSTHQAQVDGVAFVDTSAGVESAESTLVREKTISAVERNFAKAVDGTIQFSLHPDNYTNTALVDGMRTMMTSVGPEAVVRQLRAIIGRKDHSAMLATLRLPTLVACGREDKVTPPALSQELANLVPGARLEWIEQAGHQTPLEQPARLAQLLRALVQSASTKR